MADLVEIKNALISVTDKTGIGGFSKGLADLGTRLISTGGTAKLLREFGLTVTDVSEVTDYPECLDGRVKTLHPTLLGGMLAIRSNPEHIATVERLRMCPIELVICNLYNFEKKAEKPDVNGGELIESIDIGGPTMIRAAAKNFHDVAVVTYPKDYDQVIAEINQLNGWISLDTRRQLMVKAFELTAKYDGEIATYLRNRFFPIG